MEPETEQIVLGTGTAFGQSEDIGIYALVSAAGELAAEGALLSYVRAQILMPYHAQKSHVYAIEKKLRKECQRRGITLSGIQRDVCAGVSQYMAVVTAASGALKEALRQKETLHAGQEIVLAGWAGLDGTLRVMSEKEAELRERFAPVFLTQIKELSGEFSDMGKTSAIKEKCTSVIRQVGDGGIFAALWRLASETGTGLEVDMKKISVRQETIEVCEFFHLNPYQLVSAGSFLAVTDNGEELAEWLGENEIKASVIGSLTDNNDKILRNGEDVRYIDRPAPDEYNKIFLTR